MKKALSYSSSVRFEGMLRRVLPARAEEALCRRQTRDAPNVNDCNTQVICEVVQIVSSYKYSFRVWWGRTKLHDAQCHLTSFRTFSLHTYTRDPMGSCPTMT